MPIFSSMVRGKIYVGAIKPFFDILLAVFLTLLLVPLVLFLFLIVFIDLRRSPLFTQIRVGKDEKLFTLYKLRSMGMDGDEKTVSTIGKLLRATSLDEVPQIINVLKGDMSFIGPRPLLPEYLPYYNKDEVKRHYVKPGITGWAQVQGRNDIDWGLRMLKDVFYVDNISIGLDLKILLLTFRELLKGDKTPYKSDPTIKFSDYASKR
ncbi:sugar transferase [Ekhidna sp.]